MSLSPLLPIVDVDAAVRVGRRPLDLAAAFLSGGATFLQVRAKNLSGGAFLDLSTAIVGLARPRGAIVVVNDRADIARLAGADGVHVGQDDLTPTDARVTIGPAAIVGLSTHTIDQLDAAVDQPVSYVAIGPVFGTATKATGYEPVGIEGVRAAARVAQSARLPLVAIGGITLDRARAVVEAGATTVAVIGDLVADGDPEARVREYLRTLGSASDYNPPVRGT